MPTLLQGLVKIYDYKMVLTICLKHPIPQKSARNRSTPLMFQRKSGVSNKNTEKVRNIFYIQICLYRHYDIYSIHCFYDFTIWNIE